LTIVQPAGMVAKNSIAAFRSIVRMG